MSGMTDRTLIASFYDSCLHGTTMTTKPTQPLHLRLMTAQGSNTANGTEATNVNCPGYTPGGNSMGNPSFGANASGVSASANDVTWSASGSWATIPAIEAWDTAVTPVRILQGALTASVTGVANGDTVKAAAGAISADFSQC